MTSTWVLLPVAHHLTARGRLVVASMTESCPKPALPDWQAGQLITMLSVVYLKAVCHTPASSPILRSRFARGQTNRRVRSLNEVQLRPYPRSTPTRCRLLA